jgi:dTMP kinase
MNSLFITFEGGDGSGKSTQVNFLFDYLTSKEINTIKTREPGGTPSAEVLRELLTKGETNKWQPITEALLMWAARFEHIHEVINPSLEMGKTVICDRFYDSTYAYQGIAHNLGLEKMIELKSLIIGNIEPSVTFILDIDPEIGLERTKDRGNSENRFENFDLDFHKKIRKGFLDIANKYKERCVLVNAELSQNEISKIIVKEINKRMNIKD